ncbi:hypothetical protein [Dyadobacter jiangsuensis]|uniref:Uncharacterized protein n=1 Tax=Dyadobacter jiangsuensis TaxID=1591085 RepID=A0A2P8G0G1_9BACT|nr:hypothetical protein [Dyadobacter jiangsuensis]PSL27457.1 hypothetical protein CLV60_108315 [Dyadobacter jiangsuensis]
MIAHGYSFAWLPKFVWLPKIEVEDLLVALGIIVLLLIIVYIANLILGNGKILTSRLASDHGEDQAHHHYYLPSAEMKLQVGVVIQVTKRKSDNKILSAQLMEMNCEASMAIVADSTNLLLIDYHPDIFSVDQIKIATNQGGLVENVEVQTDDRIGTIVRSGLAGAEKPNLTEAANRATAMSGLVANHDEVIVDYVQFQRQFSISSDEIYNAKIQRPWKIKLDSLQVDASFELANQAPLKRLAIKADVNYPGIMTRPLKSACWELMRPDLSGRTATKQAQIAGYVPDISRVVTVPIERKRFIKHTGMPKFSNGMLVENAISKASEVEGFISIPVNILKAIFAIPSQLLHFRITRNQELAAVAKSMQDRYDAQVAALASQTMSQSLLLENRVADLKAQLNQLSFGAAQQLAPNAQTDDLPKLGKLAANKERIRDLRTKLRKERRTSLAASQLTPLKGPVDWSNNFKDSWREFRNLELNTCVPAAAAHLIISWCSASKAPLTIPTDVDIVKAFEIVADLQDANTETSEGCDMYKFMEHWNEVGLGGQRISSFVPIEEKKIDLLKRAVYWFGGCMIGLNMPVSVQNEDRWEIKVGDQPDELEAWGGHAVAVIGYSETHFIVISWGRRLLMSNQFYETYNDESWVALSGQHWTGPQDKAPTDPTRSIAQLRSGLDEMLSSNS